MNLDTTTATSEPHYSSITEAWEVRNEELGLIGLGATPEEAAADALNSGANVTLWFEARNGITLQQARDWFVAKNPAEPSNAPFNTLMKG